ncbi:MAG: 4Fe-4S binding protein [Alphaproteobacteria bacterium]|nr:4Fe-4S binding protein [Alphaproteobacteria bacterium]
MAYEIKKDVCVKCATCLPMCPFQAIVKKPDGTFEIDQNKCVSCGVCAPTCPVAAIVIKK